MTDFRPPFMDSTLFRPPYDASACSPSCGDHCKCCTEEDVCVCDCFDCDCRYADTPES